MCQNRVYCVRKCHQRFASASKPDNCCYSARLAYSARTALHVPLAIEVDMNESTKLIEDLRARTDVHVSWTDILVKAVARALEDHPIVNSVIIEEQIRIIEDINIGVAVASDDRLIVPVIHDANKKSIIDIAETMKVLTSKIKEEKSLTKEFSGGTFTISNRECSV